MQMFADTMQIQAKCCTKEVPTEVVRRVTKNRLLSAVPLFQRAMWLYIKITYEHIATSLTPTHGGRL